MSKALLHLRDASFRLHKLRDYLSEQGWCREVTLKGRTNLEQGQSYMPQFKFVLPKKTAGEIMAVFINRQANLSLIYKVIDWLAVINSINKTKALLSLSIALKIKYKVILVVYGSGISS